MITYVSSINVYIYLLHVSFVNNITHPHKTYIHTVHFSKIVYNVELLSSSLSLFWYVGNVIYFIFLKNSMFFVFLFFNFLSCMSLNLYWTLTKSSFIYVML